MTQHSGQAATDSPITGAVAATPDHAKVRESVFAPSHRALTVGVILSVSMVAFESLGVATVLPDIARHLHGLNSYGWGLAALMLANIIGTVIAGQTADRRGPYQPMLLGLLLFAAGCALAGAALNWPLFLLGRFAQGLGVGAVMGMAYTVIGLSYPERLRARMFASISSAWTVPSLIGPTIAATIADGINWRGVFVLMLPLIAIAAGLTLPGLHRLRPAASADAAASPAPAQPWWKGPLANSILLTSGTALLLSALEMKNLTVLIPLSLVGLMVAVLALRQVTPAGSLSARRGVPAGVVIRFLLCAVYFGSEAFLPLGATELRGLSTTQAGLGLSAGALTWVAGSALQAKLDDGRTAGRTSSVTLGFTILLTGLVVMTLGIISTQVPALIAVLGWAIGGFGMGIAFNAATTDTLEQAPAERQGEISAALQLAQTLATAVISGLGGAAIAIAIDYGAATRTALLATFILTGALALLGVVTSRRLRPIIG